MHRLHAVVLLLPLALLAAGCGGGQDEAVLDSTHAFHEAVAHEEWSGACHQLAPGTRSALEESAGSSCDHALAGERLPAPGRLHSVEVFGTTAQVRYANDTLFLARFEDGWRLMAAGCTSASPKPYDCRLQGD